MVRRRTIALAAALLLLAGAETSAQVLGKAKPSPPPTAAPTAPSAPAAAAAEPAGAAELRQGVADYQDGAYEEALAHLTKVRELDPASSLAAYYLGATLKKLQQYSDAIPPLKDATALQPAVLQAFLELADAYYAVGRMDEALHAIEVCEREKVEPAQTAFLKGLVLAHKGQLTAAATSFDAAKSLEPAFGPAADYQIALVYHRRGKTRDARDLFRQVAERDPDSDVGGMARQQETALTERIETAKPFRASADLLFLYDTNVILKPDVSTAQTASISNERDTSAALAVRAEYAPELPTPYGVAFQYGLYANKYSKLSQYDMQSHTIAIVPSYRIGEASAALELAGNYTLVDNAKYLRSAALSPSYTVPVGDGGSGRAFLRYQKKEYLVDAVAAEEDRDGHDLAGGGAWFRPLFDQQGYLTVRYELNKETTKGRNWTYLGNKLFAGLQYPVTDRWQALCGLEVFLQSFDEARQDPLNVAQGQVRRKDTAYTASLQGVYALGRRIDLHLDYLYIKNDSTMDLYAYAKHMIGLGVNAKF